MTDLLLSMHYDSWILPALLIIPLVGAAVILTQRSRFMTDGSTEDTRPRRTAFVVLLVEFIVSMGLWWSFQPGIAGWQAGVDYSWIPMWGIRFTLGVDGISLMMVLLTTFIMPLTVLGSWTSVRTKVRSYYALMLVLTSGMLGVFLARDLFLFYVMWEVMLVPMYFIIGVWGGERRIYASIKFFLYTMLPSLLMLVAIVYLGLHAGSSSGTPNFSYDHLLLAPALAPKTALLLFGAFFLAFAVKVPMFPFHTWLPDAHVEAPTAGSVILASIMLKMGTFGFLRLALPLFPGAAMNPTVRMTILVLAVIGIIYGALVAMVQPDFKKLVAYSSVSHLGFVMLGIFALTVQSVQGALMVMINHGISTGALFLLIGMIYERKHSRLIDSYGGIARVVPMFAAALTFVSLSSIGLPGTNGFVGEFLVLVGSFKTYPVLAIISATGVIFAAAYLLWAIQRILFNKLDKPENAHIPDLNRRELAILAPLVAAIIWLGVYPAPVLRRMESSVEALVTRVEPRLHELRSSFRPRSLAVTTAASDDIRSRDTVAAERSAPSRSDHDGGAMLLLLWAAWRPESEAHQRNIGFLSIGVCLVTMAVITLYGARHYGATGGVVAVDSFRWAADMVVLIATIGCIALSIEYNGREGIIAGETHVLILLATSGMMILVAARDLMIVFLGIEMMSIAVYVLAGMNRRSPRAAEAALKYFLLGAFSTAFLLYGIALVYGATGATNLTAIGNSISQHKLTSSPMLLIGVGLLLTGFGFKIAAVPFHMWAPDVYEGAPTPTTAYMAAAVKAAAFAAFLRVWLEAFPDLFVQWHLAVWWIAAATMVVGNLVALAQKNIKRMLAYSSIAHGGYILVALVIGNAFGGSAALFYLFAYTLATLGAFGVICALGEAGEPNLDIRSYSGLWTVRPAMAVAMAIFMLALLGFPIFGGIGFFAKWYILKAALQATSPQPKLAVVLVLTSVISAGYYLYVVMVMFMRPREDGARIPPQSGPLTRGVIWAAAVLIIVLGIFPDAIASWAETSVPRATNTAPQSPQPPGSRPNYSTIQ